jgi:acetyltransferase-like isoleucine patch superfamily enzyme
MKHLIVPAFTLFTIIGQFIGGVLVGVAFMPSYYMMRYIWNITSGAPESIWNILLRCLSFGWAYFLFGHSFLIVGVSARHLLRLRNREGSAPIISFDVFGVAAYNFIIAMAQMFFLPLVRGTPMIVGFFRGMGMKIGRNSIVMTHRIYDCDMIEIGNNCVIGGNVAINAHTGERGRGVMSKVTIGNRVSIGANTMILPGVTIEDNVMVGANSLIPKGMRLRSNRTYGGVPLREIGAHNSE